MKKLLMAIVALMLALSLAACGGGKPPGMSQTVYDRGQNVVKITEQYLNGDITLDSALVLINKETDVISNARTNNSEDSLVSIYSSSILLTMQLSNLHEEIDYKTTIEDHLQDLKDCLAGR